MYVKRFSNTLRLNLYHFGLGYKPSLTYYKMLQYILENAIPMHAGHMQIRGTL